MTAVIPALTSAAPSRRQLLRAPLQSLVVLGAATVAVHLRDPHVSGSWGFCPSRLLFGIDCPGCGGLRAVNDLTHGDLAGASSSNLAFVVALPFIVVALGLWTARARGGRPYRIPARAVRPLTWATVVLLVVFTVLRNVPAGAWLAP